MISERASGQSAFDSVIVHRLPFCESGRQAFLLVRTSIVCLVSLFRLSNSGGNRTVKHMSILVNLTCKQTDMCQLFLLDSFLTVKERFAYWCRCRIRSRAVPQILAGVRNLTINWFRSQKTGSIAQALRDNAWNPQRLFAQLDRRTN